jgi:hypothetical protein
MSNQMAVCFEHEESMSLIGNCMLNLKELLLQDSIALLDKELELVLLLCIKSLPRNSSNLCLEVPQFQI